jgi:hypothetical protein
MDKNIIVFKWGEEKLRASIVTMINLGYKTYLTLIGQNLFVCFTLLEEGPLKCFQYMKSDNKGWGVNEARDIMRTLAEEGYISNPADTAKVLKRLPKANLDLSNFILGMIGSISAKSFLAWQIKKGEAKLPTKEWVSTRSENRLQEEVKKILKDLNCSKQEFADVAKINIVTLTGFLDNTTQPHRSTLNKIRIALESFQSKEEK